MSDSRLKIGDEFEITEFNSRWKIEALTDTQFFICVATNNTIISNIGEQDIWSVEFVNSKTCKKIFSD